MPEISGAKINERSYWVNETCSLLDVKTEDEEYSPTMKGTGASRMQRDKEDVNNLVFIFNQAWGHQCGLSCDMIAAPNVTQALIVRSCTRRSKDKNVRNWPITQIRRYRVMS